MITFQRDNKKLKICIKHGAFYNDEEIWLYWDCDNEIFAQLLRDKIDDKFDRLVEAIRQEEYQRGYKDGRSKRGKASWFTSLFKTGVY